MTQTQSLRRGMRQALGLGTSSRGDSGEGDKEMLVKCSAPKLRHVQQTRDGVLHLMSGKTSNAPTLSSRIPSSCLARSSSVGPVLKLGPQMLLPMLECLPCPLSPLLAPGSCSRSKSKSSPVVF